MRETLLHYIHSPSRPFALTQGYRCRTDLPKARSLNRSFSHGRPNRLEYSRELRRECSMSNPALNRMKSWQSNQRFPPKCPRCLTDLYSSRTALLQCQPPVFRGRSTTEPDPIWQAAGVVEDLTISPRLSVVPTTYKHYSTGGAPLSP